MEQAAPAARYAARFVLTLESNKDDPTGGDTYAALNALEKLRVYLSKLVGTAGYQALLGRALTLAKQQVNWLSAVRVQSDATLTGFREAAQKQIPADLDEGSTLLLAQLLALLVIFIGEALTMRVIGDVWPEARLDDVHFRVEEKGYE